MHAILADPDLGRRMGQAGGIALRAFTPDVAAAKEAAVLERARRNFMRGTR